MRTFAILPMKPPEIGKTRLAGDLEEGLRRALAWAMFSDVLTALGRTSAIDETIVVTPDVEAARVAALHGAGFVDDPHARDHSEAALLGVAHAIESGADRTLLVAGDCPLIDPSELDALLEGEVGHPSCLVVPDRHGTGTNALLLAPPDAIEPAFGPGSHERHLTRARDLSITARTVVVESLGHDVDTREDLLELVDLLDGTHGAAAHTRGLISQLGRASLGI